MESLTVLPQLKKLKKNKMTKTNTSDRKIVIPGEALAEGMDYLPGQWTYREKENIYSTRLGVVSIDGMGRETKGSANTLSELTGKSFYPDLLVTDVDYVLAGGDPRHILDNPNDFTIQGIQNRFDGVRNSLPAVHDEGYYVSLWD